MRGRDELLVLARHAGVSEHVLIGMTNEELEAAIEELNADLPTPRTEPKIEPVKGVVEE